MISPTRWVCPNCSAELVKATTQTIMHPCPGLHGLLAPMVPFGTKAEHRLVEREDYIGTEVGVRMVEQRPIMSVVTERSDGRDATVFAPTATVSTKE